MVTSVRPLSRFAHYECSGNDAYDRIWLERLRSSPGSVSVPLRQGVSHSIPSERYVTESQLVARILAGDQRAALWFMLRFERVVGAAVRQIPIPTHQRHEIVVQAFAKLWEQDYRRLRDWQADGRGRLSSCVSTLVRKTAFDWICANGRTQRRRKSCRLEIVGYINSASRAAAARAAAAHNSLALIVDTGVMCVLGHQRREDRRTASGMLRRDAEILRRRYYFGQSYGEIAAAMGLTPTFVGVALNRAQERMQNRRGLRDLEMY